MLAAASSNSGSTQRVLQSTCRYFWNEPTERLSRPWIRDVDFSVVKNTPITERVKAQFRIEMFNLFNRTTWLPPAAPAEALSFDPSKVLSAATDYASVAVLGVGDTIATSLAPLGSVPGKRFNMQLA